MNIWVLIIGIFIIVFFSLSGDKIYAQGQDMDEYLEWSQETNYDIVLITILIIIGLSVMANYLWSKRKGRRYSEE